MEGKPEEKKGLLKKLKDGIEDQEQQIQILGTFVRLGVVVWSGFIITLNYVELPMVKKSGTQISRSWLASLLVLWLLLA